MTERFGAGKVIFGIFLILALLWTAAYTSGLVEMFWKENLDPTAYGVASRYETWDNPIMPVFLWQGRIDGDPDVVPEGLSPTGDTHGNAGAFSLKQIKPEQTVDNVGWIHFAEEKLNNNDFYYPVFTIKNKFGGKIRAVYEFGALIIDDIRRPALIWSTDTTRVPWEYRRAVRPGIWDGRYDVSGDWSGAAESEGVMVLNIPEAMYQSWRGGPVYFNDLYPGGSEMDTVYREELDSELILYALDPEDENKILATAVLTITCYTPWKDTKAERGALSEDQIGVLRRLDMASHYGCLVRMDEYEEEIILE